MKKIIIIAIVLATILFPNVGADNNFSFETDLIAGDSLVYEVVLNNTEKYEIECILSAQTTPNDEGIDISFSDDKFNIRAESQYTLSMYINTSMFLTPETYVITVTFMKEGKNVEPTYSPKHYSSEDEEEDEEEQNGEQNNTEPELPDTTEEEQQSDESTGSDEGYNFWWIFIIIIIIAIVIVIYVIKKHKGAKKNEKNRKR